jgi:ADP-heptose:LPS heptosyltransferase
MNGAPGEETLTRGGGRGIILSGVQFLRRQMSRNSPNHAFRYASAGGDFYARHDDRLQHVVFDATSRLTNVFPRAGRKVLNGVFLFVSANPLLAAYFDLRNRRVVRRVRSFRRILVIPDIHIGDAILSQAAVTAMRDFFPDARVDLVLNKAALPLIAGNPEITRAIPLFSGGAVPSEEVVQAVHHEVEREAYDLCLNLCPYIRDREIRPDGRGVINIMSRTPTIVGNEWRTTPVNHLAYHMYRLPRDLLRCRNRPARKKVFQGVRLTLGDKAIEGARSFAAGAGAGDERPVVMFNPDAASPFTRMPFDVQAALLARLAESGALILLGEGHTDAGIGRRLRDGLPPRARRAVRLVPASLPLEVYSALIDWSDVFISGDTGPLHLAAARKHARSGRRVFRNRTAVLSVFGATPARMSGYDSTRTGFLPACQDAPSWTYVAGSPCRNITCLNKIYKTCTRVRCFERFDVERVAGWVGLRLSRSSRASSRKRMPTAA